MHLFRISQNTRFTTTNNDPLCEMGRYYILLFYNLCFQTNAYISATQRLFLPQSQEQTEVHFSPSASGDVSPEGERTGQSFETDISLPPPSLFGRLPITNGLESKDLANSTTESSAMYYPPHPHQGRKDHPHA